MTENNTQPSRDELERRLAEVESRLNRLEAAAKQPAKVTPPPLPKDLPSNVYSKPPTVNPPARPVSAELEAAEHIKAKQDAVSSKPPVLKPGAAEELAALRQEKKQLESRRRWEKLNRLLSRTASQNITSSSELEDILEPASTAASKRPAAPKSSINWEQQIGQKWMLLAGLAVMLLGGLFFFKFAIDRGWIPNPPTRCLLGVGWSLVMLVLGEVVYRKGKKAFAAGLFSVGVVILYYICWVASPNGLYYPEWKMLSTQMAFAAMCGVTVLGVSLAIRANFLPGAVIATLGALATPVMLSTGQNAQVELMSYLLVVDIGYLAVAMWKRWTPLVWLSMIGTWIIFAGWFTQYADESPVALTVGFGWAFVALGYACGFFGARSDRMPMSLSRGLLYLGTAANTLIWMGLEWQATSYLGNLTLGAIILCSMSLLLRCNYLAYQSLLWTIFTFAATLGKYSIRGGLPSWHVFMEGSTKLMYSYHVWGFSWILAVWFMAVAWYGQRRKCLQLAQGQLILAAGAAVWLWPILELPEPMCLWSLFSLSGLSLTLAYGHRWNLVRPFVVGWTIVALIGQWSLQSLGEWSLAGHSIELWTSMVWLLFAMFSGELLIKSRREIAQGGWAALDGVMVLLTSVGWFASTLLMLYWDYERFMGGYSLGCMAISFGLSWVHYRRLSYRVAGRMYLLAGLAMLLTAVPMQLDNYGTTIGWIVLGLGLVWLARRYRSVTIVSAPLAAMLLAVVHFVVWEIPFDPPMRDVAFTALGIEVSYLVLLGVGLAAGCLTMAVYLDTGRQLLPDGIHTAICTALCMMSGMLLFGITAAFLPAMVATYWLAIGALLAIGFGGRLRQKCTSMVGLFWFLLAVAKYVLADMLYLRADQGAVLSWPVVANWQVLLGVILMLGLSLSIPRMLKRVNLPAIHAWPFVLVAGILLVWTGSYEVDRFVMQRSEWIDDPFRAIHMGLSLWWALVATVALVTGFVIKRPGVRYFAIGLFALTLSKVFIVDMQGIGAAYRILSFMGLGVLLVGGSWLYHRSYKAGAARLTNASDDLPEEQLPPLPDENEMLPTEQEAMDR